MFSVVFADLLDPKKIDSLREVARKEITVRGYNYNHNPVRLAPELSNNSWFLPINEIVSDYCPTYRYSYLKKYVPDAKIQLTWDSFKGRIIDNLYEDLYNEFAKYTNGTKLKDLILRESLEKFKNEWIEKIKKDIERENTKIATPPNGDEIDIFINNIGKLLKFEIELCSAIVDYRISTKEDINLKAEIGLLFPFVFRGKINASKLGFSGGLELDFIYKQMVVGEIKAGEWREFYNLSCAAYALAYEFEHKRDLDLGVILCPIFHDKRTVPLYYKSEIKILDDIYRKAVLLLRDKKIGLMREGKDPKTPRTKVDCPKGCGYLNYCWGEDGKK
jgi:CRISPR/Cas system-associated exonuclease Cas4 (RecB family)